MSTVYLVRHGQASAGTDNYDRLSDVGRRQARLLGQWWQRTGFSADRLYHGELERQRDTATIAMQHAGLQQPVLTQPLLDEYDHVKVDHHFAEGERSDTNGGVDLAGYTAIMRRWHQADESTHPELERFEVFAARGWQAVESADADSAGDARLVLFTSGGIIATLLGQVLDMDFERTMSALWHLRNASITTLEYHEGQATLIDFNTVSHLHNEADPSLITLI